jgi:pimeloyl-ACP methyl ester carboxylesterase
MQHWLYMSRKRVFIGLLAISCALPQWESSAGEWRDGVTVTVGSRRTALGDDIDYALFVPADGSSLAGPPYPALVLTHGFARDYGRHIASAVEYAGHGILVMTPNMAPEGGGAIGPQRVVQNTVDHVQWLAAKGVTRGDPLFGLVDVHRMALAGHSAGGAVSFEATTELQRSGMGPLALVLLDAVPYASTLAKAPALEPLPLLSLRSEPGACNANASVGRLVERMTFVVSDLRIVGATHCDPENPSDISCEIVCGRSEESNRETYLKLTDVFLRNVFGRDGPEASSFERFVRRLERRGLVEILSLPAP